MANSWQIKHLGDVAKISSGKIISSKEISDTYTEGLYPCYGGNGLRGYVKNFLYDGRYPIIGRVGALCGNVHLTDGPFFPTEHALVVSIKTDDDPKFIEYLLKSMNLNQYAKGVAQPVLSASTVSELTAYFPSVSEQKRIVAELDLLSGIIEKKNAQLRTLDELAMSIFAETFENHICHGREIPLERCIEKVRYTTKLQTKDFLKEGRVPIISQEEVFISGYWDNPEDAFIIKKPVVIFGDHTRVLKYVDFDFVLGADGVKILQPIDGLDSLYLYYFLRSNPVENLGYSRHFKLLKEKMVFIPPISLQAAFAEKARFLSKQMEIVAESIKEAKTLLDSRMDKYFND